MAWQGVVLTGAIDPASLSVDSSFLGILREFLSSKIETTVGPETRTALSSVRRGFFPLSPFRSGQYLFIWG